MKRWHLFEFNDAPWVPPRLQALVTDYLRTFVDLIEPFSPQLPLMAVALRHAGQDARVVDLCSGSGGPWGHLGRQLDQLTKREVPVLLTDKYPDEVAAGLWAGVPRIEPHSDPVDATAVPDDLDGMRTLFNGFHHFRPEVATDILRSAARDEQPIVVMELLRRSYIDLLAVAVTPLLVWAVTPWIRPFSWQRLVLTYLLPVAPLIIAWDTLVSLLRCYTPQELSDMGRVAAGNRYVWIADTYRYRARR